MLLTRVDASTHTEVGRHTLKKGISTRYGEKTRREASGGLARAVSRMYMHTRGGFSTRATIKPSAFALSIPVVRVWTLALVQSTRRR